MDIKPSIGERLMKGFQHLREFAAKSGLDYNLGFDYNVWQGTYISAREAMGCSAGLGLVVLYALAMTFGNAAGLGDEHYRVLCYAMGISVAVVFGVLSYLSPQHQRFMRQPPFAIGASITAAASTLLLPMASLLDEATVVPVTIVLGACIGLGIGCVLLYWSTLFARLYIPDIASCAIAGTACALVAFALWFAIVPGGWRLVVAAFLPLVCAAVIAGVSKAWPTGLDSEEHESFSTFYERRHQWPLFTYKVALPLMCVGIVLRVLLNHVQPGIVNGGGIAGILGLLVAVVASYLTVTFGIAGLRRSTQSYARLLSMIIPLVALVSLPVSATPPTASMPANMSTVAAFLIIVALTWTFMESMVLEYFLAPLAVVAQGLGFLALGCVVATPLIACVPDGSPWFDIICSVVCILMVLGMLPAHPAATLSRSTYAEAAAVDSVENIVRDEVPKAVEVTMPTVVLPPMSDGERDVPRGKGRFIRRCEYVAQLYMLSPREYEVLVLLAKGRSMNYIKDELVVSEGTAKTHIRHVYKKLNVHSRHELIGLIESIDMG